MKYVLPKELKTTDFSTNNISITETAWDSGTNYVTGDRVYVDIKVYEAVANNTNENPPDNLFDGSTGSWVEVGYINKWKFIDGYINTQSESTYSYAFGSDTIHEIELNLSYSFVDSVVLFGVEGYELVITQTVNGSDVVVNKTISLTDNSGILDWYEYFFADVGLINSIKEDIYIYLDSVVNIKIRNKNSVAKLGNIIIGRKKFLGDTRTTPNLGIIDYSKKITDDFGNTYLHQGNYKKKQSYDVLLSAGKLDAVHKQLIGLRGTPVVFIGSEGYESMLIWGFYKDFRIRWKTKNYYECNIEIESLI